MAECTCKPTRIACFLSKVTPAFSLILAVDRGQNVSYEVCRVLILNYWFERVDRNKINRISAARLHALSHVLGVDANYFFDGAESPLATAPNNRQRLSLDVARNFTRIRNDRCREAFAQLCRAMAEEEQKQSF